MDLQQIKATAQAAAAEGASLSERRRFYTAINPQIVLQCVEQWERATEALENPRLAALHMHENMLTMGLQGGAAQILAEAYAEQFRQIGAVNHIEISFTSTDPAIGQMVVTLQRVEGKTPATMKAEAEARVRELEGQLAAAQADVARLDSGVIMTRERDDFGEEYNCERRGLNLRAMIDAAIEAGTR
ncbi:hypothetical protein [Cupriavidus pauculus]|uniref:hypothetical protein n=1 Tax=Cupriavidus pauculus TaxID=82633 RepID=UPI001D0C316E|nr:hypothetical protein [Cupriavidus pauculus]